MSDQDWNAAYKAGTMPWDSAEADPTLVALVEQGTITPSRALDIGCGTGTHALWLAERGFEVVGIDLAPLAIERARAKAAPTAQCRFEVSDFLRDEPVPGEFAFVFDRGCFHVFDEPEQRARFAARVANLLAPAGQWLSLIGSTEGPPREMGPPRRSARDILNAIEPSLELVMLRGSSFEGPGGQGPDVKAWQCLSQRREVPAQPSSRYGV